MAWARDPIENQYLVSGQLKKKTEPRWAAHLSLRYGHAILVSRYLVLTGVINRNMDVQYQRSKRLTKAACLSTYYLEYGRHLARLRRRRGRAYAPTSNTASHDNHEKIHWWVSLDFHISGDAYGAPLGGPRSSAISDDPEKCPRDGILTLNQRKKQNSLWQKCS